ncbi:MAG: hypothetical protein ACPGVA_05315 [Pikeienuella sp.]
MTFLALGSLLACTPPPPVSFEGFNTLSPKAISVVMGAPLVDGNWDRETGPVIWRREIREYYQTPRRIFKKGRFLFDDHTTHEFLLTCDLTATLRDGKITSATLSGAPRACNAIREDAQRITLLIDVLRDEATTSNATEDETEE